MSPGATLPQRSHNAVSTFPQRSLSAVSTIPPSSLSAVSTFPQRSLSAVSTLPQRCLNLPSTLPQLPQPSLNAPSAPSTFPQRSLNLPSTLPQCCLNLPSALSQPSLNAVSTFPQRSHNLYATLPQCYHNVFPAVETGPCVIWCDARGASDDPQAQLQFTSNCAAKPLNGHHCSVACCQGNGSQPHVFLMLKVPHCLKMAAPKIPLSSQNRHLRLRGSSEAVCVKYHFVEPVCFEMFNLISKNI